MSLTPDYLSKKNPHERDKLIKFFEEPHIYTVNDEEGYISVTTWNHSHFEEFNADSIIDKMMNGKNWNENNKYWGMNKEQIKHLWDKNKTEASTAGTKLHYDIECYYNKMPVSNSSIEYQYFLDFANDPAYKYLIPYRTEWMIYDQEFKFAGSVDALFKDENGDLEIYDWKRSKEIKKNNTWNKRAKTPCINHLCDTNFWHYSLQLNTYKAILEKNYGKKVSKMCLVVLHPANENSSYIRLEVPDLSREIKALFELRLSQLNNTLDYALPNLIQQFIKNKSEIIKLQEKHNDLLKKINKIDDTFSEDIDVEEKIYKDKHYNVDTFNNYIYNEDGDLIGIWDDKPKLFK